LRFVRWQREKERYKPSLDVGNVNKFMTAPVFVIIGMDNEYLDAEFTPEEKCNPASAMPSVMAMRPGSIRVDRDLSSMRQFSLFNRAEWPTVQPCKIAVTMLAGIFVDSPLSADVSRQWHPLGWPAPPMIVSSLMLMRQMDSAEIPLFVRVFHIAARD
jgi:hypothetical protein